MQFRRRIRSDSRAGALTAGAVGLITGLAALAGPLAGAATADSTASFSTLGNYTFTVPDNVTSIAATAIGGAGGSCFVSGGEAASVGGTFAVTPGEQLTVTVAGPGQGCTSDAQGGFGGGGTGGNAGIGGGGGGGGASVLSGSLSDPAGAALLVAAGGGGAGQGGAGGNAGAPGAPDLFGAGEGGAGTATAGGAGGVDPIEGSNGSAGGALTGGNGGSGGGAGLFGGGGGVGGLLPPLGGGGGGASFIAAAAVDTSGPTLTTATPSVTIIYPTATADLSSNALAFGSEAQGSVGSEQTATVTNNGDAPLLVSGVKTGGPSPGDYLISDRCQLPVAPGTSCQIGLRFAPGQQGASSATLTLLTDAASAPAPIALSGTGTAPSTGTGGTQGSPGPQAPAGSQGATGTQGLAGSQGSAGAAGQVVCRDISRARALCTLEFAPGSLAGQGGRTIHATFVVKRSGRHVRAGRLTARTGRISRQSIGSLARGRYTLFISVGQGPSRKLLLTYPFQVR